MTIRVRSIGLIAVLCAGIITVNMQRTAEAADDNQACELVTAPEIESVLGTNVTLKGSDAMPGGKTQICMGQASSARVMLRLVRGLDPHRDRSGSKEKAGIEMMKQLGAKVEVKSFGPIVCSTLEPPTDKQQMGYNTTCTVNKDTAMAGIEITANKKMTCYQSNKCMGRRTRWRGDFRSKLEEVSLCEHPAVSRRYWPRRHQSSAQQPR